MAGVGRDEGGGRRLPQWMMGPSVADQVGKSGNSKAKNKHLDEELSSQNSHPKPRTKRNRPVKESLCAEEESLLGSSDVLVKCKTKTRKLRGKLEDADSDTDVSEHVVLKKCNGTRRNLSESYLDKTLKTRDCESREESGIHPWSEEDEDVDLTVEDLITIAKEYVRDDKDSERDQVSKSKHENMHKSRTAVSNDLIDTITNSHDISAYHSRAKATNYTNASAFSESKSSPIEEVVLSSSSTGDPAYDMLSLFLGPLLKKPVDEKKSDFLSKDLAISAEFEIRTKTNIVREEIAAPMTKKKSSLKDKIAMFID